MSPKLIVALDDLSQKIALSVANQLSGKVWGFKVTELIDTCGVDVIYELKRFGNVMADPKLFDIPDTVERRLHAYIHAEADLVTIHAAGDRKMLERVAKVCEGTNTKPIAITALTSWDDKDCVESYGMPVAPMVDRLANKCQVTGISGVVCSVAETRSLKEKFGPDFIVINPGIRLAASERHDQKRTATPEEAKRAGADYIVVGRDIVHARNRTKAVMEYIRLLKD